MSLRDDMKLRWRYNDTEFTPPNNPLLSKRLVLENLNQILSLLKEDPPGVKKRIEFLIYDIKNDKLKPGNL